MGLSACSFSPSLLGVGDATTYGPTSGARFLTRDPIEVLTREAYAYAGNNPVNFTDPTGLYWGEGVVDFFTGDGCGPSLGGALDGLGNLLGDIGSSALDNSFLRGVATTFVVFSFCASTGGIGCLLLVGGLTGAGLSGLSYYVNDKQGGLGGHVAVGLISGSTSGVSAGIWGMLAKGPTQGAFTFFRTSVPGTVITAPMAQRARFFVGGAAGWMIGR